MEPEDGAVRTQRPDYKSNVSTMDQYTITLMLHLLVMVDPIVPEQYMVCKVF